MTGLGAFFGLVGGAILGGIVVIAYNTSANVAALEGGREHLTFGLSLAAIIGGAFVGALLGALVGQAAGARRD